MQNKPGKSLWTTHKYVLWRYCLSQYLSFLNDSSAVVSTTILLYLVRTQIWNMKGSLHSLRNLNYGRIQTEFRIGSLTYRTFPGPSPLVCACSEWDSQTLIDCRICWRERTESQRHELIYLEWQGMGSRRSKEEGEIERVGEQDGFALLGVQGQDFQLEQFLTKLWNLQESCTKARNCLQQIMPDCASNARVVSEVNIGPPSWEKIEVLFHRIPVYYQHMRAV